MPENTKLVADCVKHPLMFPGLVRETSLPDVDIQAWHFLLVQNSLGSKQKGSC